MDGPAAPPPAAPDGRAGIPAHSEWVPDAITAAGGLLCAAVGLTVIVAWFVRATAILRFGSENPMSFNTALAFVVTGVALVALARKRPRGGAGRGRVRRGGAVSAIANFWLTVNEPPADVVSPPPASQAPAG
jgi:hypothetical protein